MCRNVWRWTQSPTPTPAARLAGWLEDATGEVRGVEPLALNVGVPGLSAPDNPVYGGSAAHAWNEHIRVADLALAIVFTIALLDELGR